VGRNAPRRCVKLGFVKGGSDNVFFWIESHLLPLLLFGAVESQYESPMSFFVGEGDPSLMPLHPHHGEILVTAFRRPRVKEQAQGIVSEYL
jgi:hypothetical protein